MTTYSVYLITSRGSKSDAPIERIECESDAQAVVEACKVFRKMPEIEAIEVWDGIRRVVNLGGRAWADGRR